MDAQQTGGRRRRVGDAAHRPGDIRELGLSPPDPQNPPRHVELLFLWRWTLPAGPHHRLLMRLPFPSGPRSQSPPPRSVLQRLRVLGPAIYCKSRCVPALVRRVAGRTRKGGKGRKAV